MLIVAAPGGTAVQTSTPSADPEKVQRLNTGARTDLFIDPEGYRRVVRGAKDSYLEQLEQEKRE